VPLLDHFHRPWKTLRPWEGFYSTSATTLAQKLNHGWLPPHHFAVPNVHLGNRLEIDVANLEEETGERSEEAGATNAATATALWAPPRPTVSGPVDFTDADLFEVRVFDEQDTPRLVAAIELVSPSNKDRASHRQAFGIKCASYLQQGVGVLVVDIVTSRSANLHDELLRLLQFVPDQPAKSPEDLYTASYRTAGTDGQGRLDVWVEALAVGNPLPVMPLWISEEQSVPVNLEDAYTAARETLLMQ
jgi:Protein of unknown function (DUF4058)